MAVSKVDAELILVSIRIVFLAQGIRARRRAHHEAGQVRRGEPAAPHVLRRQEESHEVAAPRAGALEVVVVAHAVIGAFRTAAHQVEREAVAQFLVAQGLRRGRVADDAVVTAAVLRSFRGFRSNRRHWRRRGRRGWRCKMLQIGLLSIFQRKTYWSSS